MLIFQGVNTVVSNKVLKEDTFNCLVLIHKFMKSKLHEKDHVIYRNYKGTNKDYWGKNYELLNRLVKLPVFKRENIIYVVFRENDIKESSIYYFYGKHKGSYTLNRKYKEIHKIMDRLQEIFEIEDERKSIIKNFKYLQYILT